MSHFYGTVQGGRGEATRCGHSNTGIRASVQSHLGSIIMRLGSDQDGTTWYSIQVSPHSERQSGRSIMSGKLEDLVNLPQYHEFEQAMHALVFPGKEL